MSLDLTFYTVKQVAKILHKDVVTIRRYIHEGKFPGTVFFGKEYLIPRDSLVDFLHQHCPDKFAEKHIS
ncbi:MAG: helix-turn-helix domain-containing protein [Candidatus Aminicenantes bacterium]|nr:helix-turn-helix domain-containing protein [Candidatus Aminicenantes bacterium]